jgi:hypothetical protein
VSAVAATIVLDDCTKPPSVPAKIECLIKNQTTLKDELVRVGPIVEGAQDAMKHVLKDRDNVQIRSNSVPGKCLDQRSNPQPNPNPDEVRMVTCVDTDPQDKWELRR